MNRVWLFLVGVSVISGCGSIASTTEPDVISHVTETPGVQENEYRNTRFGYTFQVPEGATLYALTPEQTAVTASEDSEVVFLVDGETNFFTVRGIEDRRTPHEWLTQNLPFFYPTGDAAQRVGEFAGNQAIFLQGTGTVTSPAKLIVFSFGEALVMISYEQEIDSFVSILESFSVM